MIKLKDIAESCGVSVSTVSRALNGNPLISPEVAEKIRTAAREMGYQPNEVARSLKTNRSRMIGILYESDMDHPFFSGLLEALRSSAEKRGYDLVLLSRSRREDCSDTADLALGRRMDGVIVVYADITEDGLDRLMRNQIPVVSVDDCSRPCPMIVSDYENGTRALTEEAVRRGHRRIAFLHGEYGYATELRIKGYRAAMAAEGLPEELIPARFNRGDLCTELIRNRIGQPEPPDCFLLPEDNSALETIQQLKKAGIRVPEDIAVAGFDGQKWVQNHYPALSTFCQNLEGIGEAAVEKLLSLSGPKINRIRSEMIITGRLYPGETL